MKWFRLAGGHAIAEYTDDVVFLILAVRNVGTGMGVLQGWRVESHVFPNTELEHPPLDDFRRQGRDIYIPAGDSSFWQGALRDRDDPLHGQVAELVGRHEAVTIELLYGDGEGGQRVISRFSLLPVGDDGWLITVTRHWNLDRDDPR